MSDIDVALAEIRRERPRPPQPDTIDAALQEIRQGGTRTPVPPRRGAVARTGSAIWGALTGVNDAIDRGARGLGRTIARDVAGYRDDPRRQAGADLLRSAQLARGAAHGIVDAPLALLEGAGRLGQRADRAMGIYGGGRAVETIRAVRGTLDDVFTEGPTSGYDTAGQVVGGLAGLGGVYGGVEQGVAKAAMGSERLATAAAGTGTAARIARLARGTGRASRLARSMAANAPVTALLELPEAETSTGHVVGDLLRESDSPTAQRIGGALERGSRTLAGRAAIGLGMDALGNLVHVAFPAHGRTAPAAVAEETPDLSWLDDLEARGVRAIETRNTPAPAVRRTPTWEPDADDLGIHNWLDNRDGTYTVQRYGQPDETVRPQEAHNAPVSPEAPGGAPSTLARTAAAGTRTPRAPETPLDVARRLRAAGERPTARRVASEAGVSETEAQAAVRQAREERVATPSAADEMDWALEEIRGQERRPSNPDPLVSGVDAPWEVPTGRWAGEDLSRYAAGEGVSIGTAIEKLRAQGYEVDDAALGLSGDIDRSQVPYGQNVDVRAQYAAWSRRVNASAPTPLPSQGSPAPLAPIPGADGREATLSFADGTRARVRYRMVEADAVQPSHDPVTFGRNPDYPEGVQGRDYHRDRATQERVAERTVGFDPERLLDPTEMASTGPPVTTPAGLAVAGNERTMLRQRVPEMNPAADQAYRAALAERLPAYGIDPTATEGMRRPMLVRELVPGPGQDLTHPETLRDLNTRSDLEVGKVKDVLSDAATRARQMQGGAALQHFADTVAPDQSLRDYLGTAPGRQFVESLVADGVIQRSEIPRYVDARTGTLNPAGVGLVEKSLYLSAIPDTSLVEAAPPALLQQLEGAIPHIVQAAQVEGWGLQKALQEALALHIEARGKGLRSVGDLLANTEMFAREGSEAGDDLARFLEGANKRQTRDFFARYAEAARLAQRMAQSEDLFGAMPPEQAASFRALIGSQGVAERALLNLVARTGAGAAAGGTAGGNLDEEDPARGALLGAILGAATAAGVSLPFARNADEALARLRGEALRLQEDIRTRPRTEAGFVPTTADELATTPHPSDLTVQRTGMPLAARPGVVPLDTGRLTDAARSVTREAVLSGGRLAEVGAVGDLSAAGGSHPRTVYHGGRLDQEGEVLFAAHEPDLAEAYADQPGEVVALTDRSQNPLVLDTGEKVRQAWEESGALEVPGSFHPERTTALARWARSQGYDAVVVPASAFEDEVGFEWAGGTFGEPQTVLIGPGSWERVPATGTEASAVVSSATEVQAQQTVSRLEARVRSGEATSREVEAYREANALLTRAEPMDQASVARATAADVPRGTLPDGETGDLFDQPVPVMDPPATSRPRFYSRLERAVESGQRTAPATQWLKYLDNHPQGVAKGEREWTGVDEWLRSHGTQKVTRDELAAYLAEHRIDIRETVLGTPQIRGESKYSIPEVQRLEKAASSSEGDLLLTLANDEAAYRALMERFPELRDNEDWAEVVAGDVWGTHTTPTRYAQYTLPGGTDYREVLLTLPTEGGDKVGRREALAALDRERSLTPAEQAEFDSLGEFSRRDNTSGRGRAGSAHAYRSAHWDEPNILLHLRLDDRTLPSGERVLFVEELQSDWHQAGRDTGYQQRPVQAGELVVTRGDDGAWQVDGPTGDTIGVYDATSEVEARTMALAEMAEQSDARVTQVGVPDAPFKNTEEWAGLGIKRVIDEAVAGGYDRVAWTTGEQQAARYGLRRPLKSLQYLPETGELIGREQSGPPVFHHYNVAPEKVAGFVGQDLASRLLATEPDPIYGLVLRGGEGMHWGGEGMEEFYDRMLPRWAERYGKKVGVRVEPVELPAFVSPTKGVKRYSGPELTDGVLRRADPADESVISYGDLMARERLLGALRRTDNPAQRRDVLSAWTDIEARDEVLRAIGDGARIELIRDTTPAARVHSFRITPELKESVRTNGQVLYTFPGPLLDALKLPAGQVAAGVAGGVVLDPDHPLRGALIGAGVVLSIRHGMVMRTVGRLARAERGGELRKVLELLNEVEIEKLADRVELWKPELAQTMRTVVQERLGPLLSSAEQAERDLADLAKGPLRPVREGVPLVAEHQRAVEAAYEGASRDLRHRIIDELEGRLETGSEADRTRYLALIDRLEARGYDGAQQLPLPGLSSTLDPEQFVRLEKFALDPTSTHRLAEQVQRVVDEHGLDPKRKVTWAETREVARQLGVDPGFVRFAGKDGASRMTGAEMLAVRNVVAENIAGIEATLRHLSENQGTLLDSEREVLEQVVAAAEAQNEVLLSRFISARSSAGRDLNSLRMLANQTMDPVVWEVRAKKVLDQAGLELTAEHRAAIRNIIAECA